MGVVGMLPGVCGTRYYFPTFPRRCAGEVAVCLMAFGIHSSVPDAVGWGTSSAKPVFSIYYFTVRDVKPKSVQTRVLRF